MYADVCDNETQRPMLAPSGTGSKEEQSGHRRMIKVDDLSVREGVDRGAMTRGIRKQYEDAERACILINRALRG